MTRKPQLLDLFCGAGGAAKGYQEAGFYVVGVDNTPQPDYCGDEFYLDDALSFLHGLVRFREMGMKGIHRAVHASPPCQSSSALTKGTNKGREYVNHIPETRRLLAELNSPRILGPRVPLLPTVIENVQGSDLRRDLTLCGEMFGLDVIRHRYFECNFPVVQPPHIKHRGRVSGMRHGVWYEGPYAAVYGEGGGKGSVARWQQAMGGIDWTDDRKSIAEMIPPAYSRYVGEQLMKVIDP